MLPDTKYSTALITRAKLDTNYILNLGTHSTTPLHGHCKTHKVTNPKVQHPLWVGYEGENREEKGLYQGTCLKRLLRKRVLREETDLFQR